MRCPSCGSEYEAGVERCEACNVALVDTLPEEEDGAGDDSFVPLRQVTDPDELPVITSALEAAGIPFVLQGEETQGLFPLPAVGGLTPPSLGAIILVSEDHLEEARDLLETIAVPAEPGSDTPES